MVNQKYFLADLIIEFQPTENGEVAITGVFILAAEEVNPVARTT